MSINGSCVFFCTKKVQREKLKVILQLPLHKFLFFRRYKNLYLLSILFLLETCAICLCMSSNFDLTLLWEVGVTPIQHMRKWRHREVKLSAWG